jgi:hypothetical protein
MPVIVVVTAAIGAAWRLSGTMARIDSNVFKLRQGIADLYPMFRRAAQSGALSGRQLIPVPAQNKPQVENNQDRE